MVHNLGEGFRYFLSVCFLALMRASIADPGRWLNGFFLPVLKHGPRSLTLARVIGFTKPRRQSEGECRLDQCVFARAAHNRPMRELLSSVSRKSVRVGTRKMVNYA